MARKKKTNGDFVNQYNEREIKFNFVPIDEKDVERSIEIPVKEKPVQEIEHIEKSGDKIKSLKKTEKSFKNNSKKSKKKKLIKGFNKKSDNWTDEFKISGNKKLKANGPILIITEKPQAAQKIASALADNEVKKRGEGVAYYELTRDEKEIQVACAVGHLFSLAQVHPRNKWPTFEIAWAPNYLVRKNDFTKKYYQVIAKLCKNASEIIVATDYDIEGEVIGMNIVRYICNQEDAERMKFSTLTADEIKNAYEKRAKTLDWKQGIAGETRHYLDWIYGINLSRALMSAIKEAGAFKLMSIGRVQGPALHIIVEKERTINAFKSEKYWQVFLDVSDGKNNVEVKYVKDITKEKELGEFEVLKGEKGEAETKKSQRKVPPNAPFDLTALQTEAYKFFSLTPSKTLEIAQRLYLAGIISYPRTSSQKIPESIGYNKIIERLKKRFDFVKYVKRTKPVEGKKSDPAHPSIFPTGEFNELEGDDKKIYELIVKRFVACFCNDAVLDNKRINVKVKDKNFSASRMGIAESGWMKVYPAAVKEKEIPDLNGKVEVKKVKIEEKMTQPPKRYSPASIISELEKKNLGTKATRASILETLYNRGYIKEKSISATALGISLIKTLEENCPIIIDEKLTRNFEKEMDAIRNSKNPKKQEDRILEETREVINKIGEQFEKRKKKIGEDLIKATGELIEQERKEAEIMECPACKKGKLAIRYAKQYRRYFVGCNNYPKCKNTYTLPPNGLIKTTDKTCEQCGFQMLISIRKGKKPWIFCFNPECASRKKKE